MAATTWRGGATGASAGGSRDQARGLPAPRTISSASWIRAPSRARDAESGTGRSSPTTSTSGAAGSGGLIATWRGTGSSGGSWGGGGGPGGDAGGGGVVGGKGRAPAPGAGVLDGGAVAPRHAAVVKDEHHRQSLPGLADAAETGRERLSYVVEPVVG